MVVNETIARREPGEAGVYAPDFQPERRESRPREKYTPFREVALLSVGKGKHGIAADERAVCIERLVRT
jgi:hypothetical protein